MENKDKLVKILIEEEREKARTNEWDDLLTLDDSEILKVNPLSEFDIYSEQPERISDNDYLLIMDYEEIINDLQEDITLTKALLENSNMHYMQRTELREDLANDERKLYEYNRLLDELKRNHAGRTR
ncbi:MAG: hypothetical protein RR478_04845 [Bacilli bacterium]